MLKLSLITDCGRHSTTLGDIYSAEQLCDIAAYLPGCFPTRNPASSVETAMPDGGSPAGPRRAPKLQGHRSSKIILQQDTESDRAEQKLTRG